MNKILSSIIVLLIGCKISFSQVTVTNPTNTTPNLAVTYTSLANAITALNGITAISGPVTITLLAGNAQTAPIGGYAIQFIATTTAVNSVTINGSNNTITAFTPQATGSINDAIFKLIGVDYVTIRNFVMQENAANTKDTASSNNMTEFGVALLRSSITDGAQHNTINNNIISLNRNYRNTFGVYSNVRHTATDVVSSSDITSITGSNSGNMVYGNTVNNVDFGAVFVGSANPLYMDNNNTVGSFTNSIGNTFTDWGGVGTQYLSNYVDVTTDSYCIYFNHQINDSIDFNIISSDTVSLSNTLASFPLGGILKDFSSGQPTSYFTSNIRNNDIKLISDYTNEDVFGIVNQGLTNGIDSVRIYISANKIHDCLLGPTALATESSFNGIVNNSIVSDMYIHNNAILDLRSNSFSGDYVGIANNAAIIDTLSIINNNLGDSLIAAATFFLPTTGKISGIVNTAIAVNAYIEIASNTLLGFYTFGSSDEQKFIYNSVNKPCKVNINNNKLGGVSQPLVETFGTLNADVYGILSENDTAMVSTVIFNNSITRINNNNVGNSKYELIAQRGNINLFDCSYNKFFFLGLATNADITLIKREGQIRNSASINISNNKLEDIFYKFGSIGDLSLISSSINSFAFSGSCNINKNEFPGIIVEGNTNINAIKVYDSSLIGLPTTIDSNIILNIAPNINNVGVSDVNVIDVNGVYGLECNNNKISGVNILGSFNGITVGNRVSSADVNLQADTITNIISAVDNGRVTGISSNFTNLREISISNSIIDSLIITGSNSSVEGIIVDSSSFANIQNNQISNLSILGGVTSTVNGIIIDNTKAATLVGNKLHTLTQTGVVTNTATPVNGIIIKKVDSSAVLINNAIANLLAPNTNYVDAIRGISITSLEPNSSNKLFHNSVSFNASSSGTNFGTSALFHAASSTATTSSLLSVNNLFSNLSTANGTGLTTAFNRSSPSLNNFELASNHNLYYAGVPSLSRLIFYDGTNSDQTISSYKTRVANRETKAISVLPDFVSTTDLHLANANCGIDGKGGMINVSNDFEMDVRDLTAPDIGADEFTSNVSTTLAGVVGTTVCDDRILSSTSSTLFKTENCNPIAKIEATGGSPIAGQVNMCVYIDPTVVPIYNTEPYVQRHIDILPSTATSSTTGTITLYFTNDEFENFNANNVLWPDLPTVAGGGNADPNKSNLRVTQYHGVPLTSPSSPNQYDIGTAVQINPDDANIIWNGNYWEVKFEVTGFSGFYVHTNLRFVLPVSINNLTGVKQGEKINLNWKVTCNNSGKTTLILERSATGTSDFVGIKNIQVIPAACSQLFSHSDFNAVVGSNYYRVKIIDEYGNVGYSNTILVLNANTGFEITNVYPNPINGNVQAKMGVSNAQTGIFYFTIFDMQGRIVKSFNKILSRGYNIVNINLSDVKSGSYIIKVKNENGESKQIQVIKN